MSKQKKFIFFDMDGTLAEYRIYRSFEDMKSQGYFRTLKPEWNIVNAFKKMYLANSSNMEVFILTKVYPSVLTYSVEEKKEWIKEILPEINPNHLIMVDGDIETKSEAIFRQLGIKISHDCVLIDDYNPNLEEWASKGGHSIKYVNGVNDKHKSFEGDRVTYFMDTPEIVEKIKEYCFRR